MFLEKPSCETSTFSLSSLTGPWCPPLGLYHTTRGTPDFSTTFPPELSMRRNSSVDSGLWSVVSRRERHLQMMVKVDKIPES